MQPKCDFIELNNVNNINTVNRIISMKKLFNEELLCDYPDISTMNDNILLIFMRSYKRNISS